AAPAGPAPPPLEGDARRAAARGLDASHRRGDADRVAEGHEPLVRKHVARRWQEKLRSGRSEPAADDDELRLEDVDEARDPAAEVAAHLRDGFGRLRLAGPRPRGKLTRIGGGPEAFAGHPIRRAARHERLEVAAPAAAALARGPVIENDHVAELSAGACRAAVRASAQDQAPADAGTEREHDHVARPPA